MPFEGPVKVLIVDDHVGIRLGIAGIIDAERPRMCSVAAVGTAREALTCALALQPHVVVLDVDLAGVDGLALIPSLHGLAPCEIVVLTSLVDPHVAAQAHRLGAHSCVHKTAPATELLACVFAAHREHVGSTPSNAGSALSHGVGTNHPSAQGACADAGRGPAA